MVTEDERKLFVAGLPESITEDVLRQLFEASGATVVDVSLPRDRATGRPRGFGFVTLATEEQAVAARRVLDGSTQAGANISVRPFQSEPPRRGEGGKPPVDRARSSPDRTLYVGNLPYDCSQESLEALFAEHEVGPVLRMHLPTGEDGRLRGFGFVTMGSAEAANGAITALRGAELGGRRIQVSVAHPRGERPPGGPSDRGDRPERVDRPERSGPPPRAGGWSGPRAAEAPSPVAPGAGDPFWDGAPRAAEGRRRAVKPERGEVKKKKRGRGREEREPASPKRPGNRGRGWGDWDED